MSGEGEIGVVYLIHLDKPVSPTHTAQHYLGWAHRDKLIERLRRHLTGRGSPMLRAAKMRGITWGLARVWDMETREFERSLKNRKNAKRLCPICRGKKEKR